MTVTEADDRAKWQTIQVVSGLAWQVHASWESIIGEDDNENFPDDDELKKVIDSVQWLIDHPSATMAQQHNRWRSIKAMDDPDHPNLVPFEELPFAQQMKARLFRHIVLAVLG